MANLSVGAKLFNAFTDGATRTAGSYWLTCPHVEGEIREFQDVTAEGTDGIEKTDHGYRGRGLGPMRVIIVGSSESDLATRYQTVLSAVENKADGITIVTPYGRTYTNCYIVSGFPKLEGPRLADVNTRFQVVLLAFTQERE